MSQRQESSVDLAWENRWSQLLGLAIFARMTTALHAPSWLDAGFALIWACLFAFLPKNARDRFSPRLLLLTSGFLMAAIIHCAVSVHPWMSFLSLTLLFGPALAFLSAYALPRTHLHALVAISLGGSFNAGYALYQKYVLWPATIAESKTLGIPADALLFLEMNRPIGLSVSTDLCAGICFAGLITSVALIAQLHASPKRTAFFALAILCFGGIASTQSTGGNLILAVWLILLLSRILMRKQSIALGAIIVAGAGGFFIFNRSWQSMGQSLHERFLNWSVAMDVWLDSPIFGVGFGRFAYAYASHRIPEANVTRYAHSLPFHWLAELGILGIVMFVTMIGLALWSAVAAYRRHHSVSEWFLLAGVCALTLRLLFDYDGQIGQTSTLIALLWGLLGASRQVRLGRSSHLYLGLSLGAIVLTGMMGVGNWIRDNALGPFEKGAMRPTPAAEATLEEYAAQFSDDVIANHIAGQIKLNRILQCTSACEPLVAQFDNFMKASLAHPFPLPQSHLLQARLAHHQNRQERAFQSIDAALELDASLRDAHIYRLKWTAGQDQIAWEQYASEAKIWLAPAVLEPILKLNESKKIGEGHVDG
jgi:O-antigen ligase